MRQLKITKQVTNRETASLDKYLQEIGKVELITDDEEVALISAYYKVDKWKLKAQFGHTDNYRGIATNIAGDDNTADYSAIGFDYSLGKKTTLGAYLGNLEGGDNLFVDPVIGGPYSKDVLGIILIHSF